MKDHPRGLLEMISMLMRLHVPSMTNAEICAILMKRAGIKKNNDVSKSLNASLHRCDVFAEACDSRDLKDDKDFFSSELKGYRVRAVTTMEWLKNKKWLGSKDLDNLAILKEDPVVMAKLRAREAALQKKTKKTAAVYKTPADVQSHSVKDVPGAWVKRSWGIKKWTARYPGVIPSSRSRTWGGAWTERQVARHVLIWQWRQHAKITGVPCPYAFNIEL